MIELRKVLVFRSLFMIADISTGYFLLWRLMGIIGLTLTFTFFMISEFISPHIGLLVSPFIDKYKKDKFQLLRVSYIIDMMLFIILYPLFLYLYVVKDLFLIVFTVGMIASNFIKSVEYKILGVTVRYLIKDYRNEVYSIRKYGLLARAIGTILGTSILSLNITENLTVILILYLIGLRLLSNINIDGEIKNKSSEGSFILILRKSLHKVIKNDVLRKIIVSNIAYSLPNALFSLFFVYLIYYSFHLPPILIGLLTVTSISGRLIGNKLARITNITRKSNWILYLIYIIPDFLIGVFLFLTNVQYLPLIYLVFFINGILGSVVGYYYSLAKYKLIPKDVYATSSSVISVISSIFDYIFTVVSSIIISLISYQGAILMSLILFIGLDTYFVPFFVNVIKSIETDGEK